MREDPRGKKRRFEDEPEATSIGYDWETGRVILPPRKILGPDGAEAWRRFGLLMVSLERMLEDYPKKDLSNEILGLSDALSRSRGSTVRQDYLSGSLTQAAYVAHFLPWNVLRLILSWQQSPPKLLPMPLITGEMKPADGPVPVLADRPVVMVTDWGAGPMTALLAMWVAGTLEQVHVHYHAVEKQGEMLVWGRRLLEDVGAGRIARIAGHTEELDPAAGAELTDHGEQEPSVPNDGRTDVLIVSQAYNEWLPARGRSDEMARSFAKLVTRSLRPNGELLLMEPANRVASWGVMVLREALLDLGMKVLAPCTHDRTCPLISSDLARWCHFRVPVSEHEAMRPLLKLSGVERGTLAFSFLHARHPGELVPRLEDLSEPDRRGVARILGDPIKLPDGRGVYACGDHGYLMLHSRATRWPDDLVMGVLQGEQVRYRVTNPPEFDRKSGARLVWLDECRAMHGGRLGSKPGEPATKGAEAIPADDGEQPTPEASVEPESAQDSAVDAAPEVEEAAPDQAEVGGGETEAASQPPRETGGGD